MAGFPIPRRPGEPPVVTGPNPHEQVTQTAPVELQERLVALAGSLPGVEIGRSYVDVEGSRAFHLSPALARGPREAFLAGTEFGHIHPGYDGSLHLALPDAAAAVMAEAGWAERHPDTGLLLVYGPRDRDEVDLVWRWLRMSYRYAVGAPEKTERWD